MRIVLEIRGHRGQLLDRQGQPIGPEFPEFYSPVEGHRQIDRLFNRLGFLDYEGLHQELDQLWGHDQTITERVCQGAARLLNTIEETMRPICRVVWIGLFLGAMVIYDQTRPRRNKGER